MGNTEAPLGERAYHRTFVEPTHRSICINHYYATIAIVIEPRSQGTAIMLLLSAACYAPVEVSLPLGVRQLLLGTSDYKGGWTVLRAASGRVNAQ